LAVVIMSGERLATAADADLHFVEDELRTDRIAARAQRREELCAHVEGAADALYGLDDHRGDVLADGTGDR
jgi:hypothetical protein